MVYQSKVPLPEMLRFIRGHIDLLEERSDAFRLAPLYGLMREFEVDISHEVSHPTPIKVPEAKGAFKWSDDQAKCWDKLYSWVLSDKADPVFVIQGYAGTGKTALTKRIRDSGWRVIFCAPTNKATKVLSELLGITLRTVYSVLSIKMTQQEDSLHLQYPDELPSFAKGTILAIDEASMIPKEVCEYIDFIVRRCGIRVIYIGDPLQLPPVSEKRSPVWAKAGPNNSARLRHVVRHDNQILTLSTEIRRLIKAKDYTYPIVTDCNADRTEGVILLDGRKFLRNLGSVVNEDTDWAQTKVIAWRNKTVEGYNAFIREKLGYTSAYVPNDILLLSSPIEEDQRIIAHTDDEGKVHSVAKCKVQIDGYELRSYRVEWKMYGGQELTLTIPHDVALLDSILSKKANAAKRAPRNAQRGLWKNFWNTKNKFAQTKYAYSITAHRSQGSTYTQTYVDSEDILANYTKREAFRCLYVASTRASKLVIAK